MKNKPYSLYDCLWAKSPYGEHTHIYCAKGHKLGDGHIVESTDRDKPLVCRTCQSCKDFEPFDIPFRRYNEKT